MRSPIEVVLSQKKMMVLDGALATELEKKGFDLHDALWSAKVLLSNPEAIAAVHRAYLEAGADCIITASYQATMAGFMQRGLTQDAAKRLIKHSVVLARETVDAYLQDTASEKRNRFRPLVAASVGPYGAYLADGSEYSGQYGVSQETLQAFHAERMALLAAAKPDLFAAETIPCMEEAKAIVEVLKAHPSYSAWMSFSAKDGNHISSGETIGECAKWLDQEPQIVAIGINCTPPQYITSLIEHIRMETEKPIIVYPNSGEHYDAVSKTWRWEQGACPYAESAVDWVKAGARIIGGCCRTGPEDIMAIVRMLNAIE